MNNSLQGFSNKYDATLTHVSPLAVSRFMSQVYRWMALGVLITALVAHYVAITPSLTTAIFKHSGIFFGLVLLQLGAVFTLSAAIRKLNFSTATLIYLAYSALTGITFSTIFLLYTQQSINSAFIVTAVAFAGLSSFGYVTKRDLSPIGSFCTMALFGLIAVMVLAMFMPKLMGNTAQMMFSILGVLIFSGLTAYDTQRIKALALTTDGVSDESKKGAILGALMLYLDFINLFLNILRLMGQKK